MDDSDTLFDQAVKHHQSGRFAKAVALYDAVIALEPQRTSAHFNRGTALNSLHRANDALLSFDRVTELEPDDGEAHYLKAVLLARLNRLDEALETYDRAIALKPDFADAWFEQGDVFRRLNRIEDAISSYDRAIALRSDFAEAYNNKGNLLRALKRLDEARECFDRLIVLKPDMAEAHNNRGTVLRDLERFVEALKSYDRAIELRSDYAEAYSNKGNVLSILGQPQSALRCYDRAIELNPEHEEAYCSKGNVLCSLRRMEEACSCYDIAIALNPDFGDAYWNKGLCRLLTGAFEEGWPLYEWRKKKLARVGVSNYSQPCWSGRESLENKTLLIYGEQGLGDTIQFCRYALLARQKGAHVVLAVQDVLVRLLNSLSPDITIERMTSKRAAFDYQVALMSLPLTFGTTLSTCPAKVPYLRAEPEKVEAWKARLGNDGFKVGICWQGNKKGDVGRAFPLRHFEEIAKLHNVRLISLQKYEGTEQLCDLPSGMKVETLGEEFDDGPDAFVDTAAVIECLDLVITLDTATAHLAGALGRPAWVALKYTPEWRWLLDRSDSPWYPTLKLFRQREPGEWRSVFAAIGAQLARESGSG